MPALSRRAALLLAFWLAPALGAGDGRAVPSPDEARAMSEDRLDGARLEHELQELDWPQFRSVIEAVPKLKADVDAYGPAGWEYVKGRYKTYQWHKNINRLDADEKQRLAALIDTAQQAH